MTRARHRLALVGRLLSSPRDVWLIARMAAWALALPILKFAVPLPRLVRLLTPRRRRHESPGGRTRVVGLAGLLYRVPGLLSNNCLERSLVMFRYLAAEDVEPRLMVGMRRDSRQLIGHVWVTVAGVPVYDAPEALVDLVPIVSFGADGTWASEQGERLRR